MASSAVELNRYPICESLDLKPRPSSSTDLISIDDVNIVILTRGMDLILQVPQETLEYITKLGKSFRVGQTADMVKEYNTLVKEGKKVGGVFHSTC